MDKQAFFEQLKDQYSFPIIDIEITDKNIYLLGTNREQLLELSNKGDTKTPRAKFSEISETDWKVIIGVFHNEIKQELQKLHGKKPIFITATNTSHIILKDKDDIIVSQYEIRYEKDKWIFDSLPLIERETKNKKHTNNTNKSGWQGSLVQAVIYEPIQVIKAVIPVFFTLSIFALIVLLIYKQMGFDLFPNEITINEAENLVGENVILEEDKQTLRDISISSNVLTLDNFNLNDTDFKQIARVAKQYGGYNDDEINALKSFNLIDKCRKENYPVTTSSFSRFENLFNSPEKYSEEGDSTVINYFDKSNLFNVFKSPEYWKLTKSGFNILAIPKDQRQISVVVLTIRGITENGKLEVNTEYDSDNGKKIAKAIEKASGQLSLSVPCEEGIMRVCMSEGESLSFSSKKNDWRITIKHILNPGSWRSNYDATIIHWAATKK